MAMTGVLRPGHIALRVLDLEEGINFYKNPLGLVGCISNAGTSATTIVM